MGMTVLQLLQAAANEMGITAPTAYTTNTQLLNLLYSVCRDLRSSRAFPQLKREHSITLTASRSQYPMPSDFYSGLLGTQRNQTNNFQLIGPISDAEYNYLLYGPGGDTTQYSYQVRGPDLNPASSAGQFTLYPTPTAADTISFDYMTKHFFVQSDYDTDNLAETAQADTDLCLFDDEIVILGLKAWYKRAKKTDNWKDYMMEYKRKKSVAASRWIGSFIGSFSRYTKGRAGRYRSDSGSWL